MANKQKQKKNKQKKSSYQKARIKAGYITIVAAFVLTVVIIISTVWQMFCP